MKWSVVASMDAGTAMLAGRLDGERSRPGQMVTQYDIIREEISDVKNYVRSQIQDFFVYLKRIVTQYSQRKSLKEALPESHVVIQTGFAECYTCISSEKNSEHVAKQAPHFILIC